MIMINNCECGVKYPETKSKFSSEGISFCSEKCVNAYDVPFKELRLSEHAWDHAAEFKVVGVRGCVSLHQGYGKKDDGIYWGLQGASVLKATYTKEEIEHGKKMREMEPINKGEIVLIDGEKYQARILGNYSDCVIFDKVNT